MCTSAALKRIMRVPERTPASAIAVSGAEAIREQSEQSQPGEFKNAEIVTWRTRQTSSPGPPASKARPAQNSQGEPIEESIAGNERSRFKERKGLLLAGIGWREALSEVGSKPTALKCRRPIQSPLHGGICYCRLTWYPK